MIKPTQKGKVAREYLLKYNTSPIRTIAKVMLKDNPLLFSDFDAARRVLNYHAGGSGKDRKVAPEKKIQMAKKYSGDNPYGLPETEAKPFEPYILPKANNRILFLSDVHLPYHDINALTLALNYGKEREINTIYLNGDIMDCYMASFHEQDPKKRDMAYELEVTRNFLDLLLKEFPKAKIFFKEGNHEMRWERFLRIKAPICLGMDEFRLSVLLKLGEKGVTWIPNRQLVQAGKLNMIHGNEYKGGGGINVARTLWLRAGDNVIAGDKHKTQSGLKTNIDKKIVGTWSVACLCELNPDYLPFNEWNLGFAYITIEKDGQFSVHNKQIINGKVV